ncbi:hypothetical protein [Clostridium sp.]|uniref:hypothetical protein n=1 Tax=Clostridium sp. TaxID=1506 RepID=UPI003D6C9257
MKRIGFSLLMVLILLFLTACNSSNVVVSVKYGAYVLEQTATKGDALPQVNISNGNITFTYDLLSSYMPFGTYTIDGNILTMTTTDKKYKYLFQVKGDKLIFHKDKSSKVNLTDDRLGFKITDNAEFKLKK